MVANLVNVVERRGPYLPHDTMSGEASLIVEKKMGSAPLEDAAS